MKRLLVIIILSFTAFSFFSQNTPSSSSVVTSIEAFVPDQNKPDAVTVTWKLPENSVISQIQIYRSNTQIFSSTLQTLKPLSYLKADAVQYNDTVPDVEASYYYAAVSVLKDSSLYAVVIPSVNATVTALTPLPIQVRLAELVQPVKKSDLRNERTLIPLPYLNIITHSEDLRNSISPESQALAVKLGTASNSSAVMRVYVFPEDEKPLSGEQYLLSTIINTSFIQNDWSKAQKDLENFLSIYRSDDITQRALFYSAQVLYYQACYPEALRLFIDTEDSFPDLSRKWIESVLQLYEIPRN